MAKRTKRLLSFLGVLLFALALWALHRELRQTSPNELRTVLGSLPKRSLLMSLFAVALDYALLTLGEWFAVREARGVLSYPRVAMISFTSNAVGFNVGVPALSGGSVRFRLYSSLGLRPAQIATIVALTQAALLFGIPGVSGVTLLFAPGTAVSALGWSMSLRLGVAILCLALPLVLLALSEHGGRDLNVMGHPVPLPRPIVLLKQFAIGFCDPLCASLVLYFLLPAGILGLGPFCAAFVLAALAGGISQVPGGLGVFDASLVVMLLPYYPRAELLGALIVYRFFYYVLPLVCAVCLLVFAELRAQTSAYFARLVSLLPYALAVWTFFAGLALLLTTAVPLANHSLALLRSFVSLPILEISHFLKSVLGTTLLFLSWGLNRHLRSAWRAAVVALCLASAVAMAGGWHARIAAFTALGAAVLLLSRAKFYRLSLLSRPGPAWIATAALVLAGVLWLGFFSFRHVEYADQLWWQFTFSDSAPRFLRAMVGASVTLLVASFLLWMRPAPPLDDPLDNAAILRLVSLSASCEASLALLGDKRFLCTPDGNTAIMYGVSGEFWIAMGNPIGDDRGAREAIWRFCETADRMGAKPVFYEADDQWSQVFEDVGLHRQPVGEDAAVDVSTMPENLEGGQWKRIRATYRHLLDSGCSFRIMGEEERPPLTPLLKLISDDWLSRRHGHEKGFSLGFFDEAYLANFPIALAESEGRPVAFCNLWMGGTGEEFSVDLMRYAATAPEDVMTFLFVETMLWGKACGYRYFRLGMTPLSNMEPEHSLWEKGGAFLYRHGGYLYNFQGLRAYKEKFHPEWNKRYLVYPGAVSLPTLLPHLVLLVSRGRL